MNNVGSKLCEALGLAAGSVVSISIICDAPGNVAEVRVKMIKTEADALVEAVRKFELVSRPRVSGEAEEQL